MRPKLRRLLKRGRARDDFVHDACFGEAPAGDWRPRRTSLLSPLGALPAEAEGDGIRLGRFLHVLKRDGDGSARRGVRAAAVWHYMAGQGSLHADLGRLRSQLDPRLYRSSGVLVGGGWCRLLLGDQYAPGRPRSADAHFLHVVLRFCSCVACAATAAVAEQDLSELPQTLSALEMLEEAAENEQSPAKTPASNDAPLRGRPEPRLSHVGHGSPAARTLDQAPLRVSAVPLPDPSDLIALCDGAVACEHELGCATRAGNARSPRIRVVFTQQTDAMFSAYCRYAGPRPATEMHDVVSNLASLYFAEHPRSKSERKICVQGRLFRFAVPTGVHPARFGAPFAPHPVTGIRQQPLGVVFKQQTLVLFHGCIALETGIGTFRKSDVPFYIGFGEDPHGAQTIFRDGELGPPRHLGVNELLVHIPFGQGDEATEIVLR